MTDSNELLAQAKEIMRRELLFHPGSKDEARAAAGRARGLIGDALVRFRAAGDRAGEGRALRRLGYIEYFAGERDVARKIFRQSLELVRDLGDQLGEAKALRGLGHLEESSERLDKASEYFGQAASIFDALGDVVHRAYMDLHRAELIAKGPDKPAAIDLYGNVSEAFREAGDFHMASLALQSLAHLYKDMGAPERWAETLDRAVEICRCIEDPNEAASALLGLSSTFMVSGAQDRHRALQKEIAALTEESFERSVEADNSAERITALMDYARSRDQGNKGRREARKAHEDALRIDAAAGGTDMRADILSSAAMNEGFGGDLNRARRYYREAIELFEEKGNFRKVGDDLVLWGQLESYAHNYNEARQLFDRALKFERKVGEPRSEAFALGQLGSVEQELGRYTQSRKVFREALELYRRSRDRDGECLTLRGLAELEAKSGDRDKARELYAEIRQSHRNAGEWHGEGYTLRDWGDMERDAGNLDAACELYVEGRDLFSGYGDLQGEGQLLGRLGRINRNRNPGRAGRFYLEAAKRFNELGFKSAFKRAMRRVRELGGRGDPKRSDDE